MFDSADDEEADLMMMYTPASLRKEQIEMHYDNGFYLSDKVTGQNFLMKKLPIYISKIHVTRGGMTIKEMLSRNEYDYTT